MGSDADDDDSFEFSDDPELDAIASGSSKLSSTHRINYNALSHYVYPSNMDERVYQRVIIAAAMFENTLVALPTGLGKTFIAATVMLNYYRWFPDSKIVFMAPTRPLVAQQIKACASITGIPASEMAVLIEKPKAMRQALWDKHRVFFSTPQVVDNDLRNQVVSGESMCLLVMDEAHRAKGNYAYNNVAQFMARLGTQCRVLALTATPATTLEGVQELVTNLKISKLAVRTDKSDDIVPYLQEKPLIRRRIGPSNEISQIMSLLADAVKPILDQANARGILNVFNPLYLSKMACVEASRKMQMDTSMGPARFSAAPMLKVLSMVGDAMSKLKIYGIKHFWQWFEAKDAEQKKSKGKMMREFWDHPNIEEVRQLAKEVAENPKAVGHPKTTATLDELQFFFAEADDSSRVIIFTELRASALELVSAIAECKGARPHIFIGQAGAKDAQVVASDNAANPRTRGKQIEFDNAVDSSKHVHARGMSQTVQKRIISEFKSGKHNVLVATSIGEEGLDIGEVDLIICYDSTSSPIKNIQRMGRTGRKRAGKVVLLFSGNEETKFDRALTQYDVIQGKLETNPDLVALSPPVRMIPPGYQPEIRREFIEIDGENRVIEQEDDDDEIIRLASAYSSRGVKPAKKSDKKKKQFLYPDGVPKGFQSVTDMLKGTPRKAGSHDTTAQTTFAAASPTVKPPVKPVAPPVSMSPIQQSSISVKSEPSTSLEPSPKRAKLFEISDDELPQYTVVKSSPKSQIKSQVSANTSQGSGQPESQSKSQPRSQTSTQPLATQADSDDDLPLSSFRHQPSITTNQNIYDSDDDSDVPLSSLRDQREDDIPLIRLRSATLVASTDDTPLARLSSIDKPPAPATTSTKTRLPPPRPALIRTRDEPKTIRDESSDDDDDVFDDGLDDILSQIGSSVSKPLPSIQPPPPAPSRQTSVLQSKPPRIIDPKRIDPMDGLDVPSHMGHSSIVQGLIDLGKHWSAPPE